MEVRIQSLHFEMSERLETFINKKIDRLAKHFDSITNADVTLKVVKPETAMNKEAVVRIAVPQHEEIFADKIADSFEEAVDLCLEAIEKQLEKRKGKK